MPDQPKHSAAAPASSSFTEKLSKLFGGLDMSWKHVIIFAVAIGVFVGLINQVPVLEETSFRDKQERSRSSSSRTAKAALRQPRNASCSF